MLVEAVRSLRAGDVLIVPSLDRLGRTKREAMDAISKAHAQGATVRLLAEEITTTAGILAFGQALAAADRLWGIERGGKGVEAARQVKTRRGRPRSIEPSLLPLAKTLWLSGKGTAKEAADQVGVNVATMYRLFGPRLARND